MRASGLVPCPSSTVCSYVHGKKKMGVQKGERESIFAERWVSVDWTLSIAMTAPSRMTSPSLVRVDLRGLRILVLIYQRSE